jgi:hypothetical protein
MSAQHEALAAAWRAGVFNTLHVGDSVKIPITFYTRRERFLRAVTFGYYRPTGHTEWMECKIEAVTP